MNLFSDIGAPNSILRASLRGLATRNEAISNNLANADVPGYRARDVQFEEQLSEMIGDFPNNRRINLDGFAPTVHFRNLPYHQRVDQNNIDIDVEMVLLYQNAMRYETMVSSIQANSERLSTVLQGGR